MTLTTQNYMDNLHKSIEPLKNGEIFNALLSTLTPREERIIRMQFGIGMNQSYSIDEIAETFCVAPTRVKQISNKAFRKLTHPVRIKKLSQHPKATDFIDLILLRCPTK